MTAATQPLTVLIAALGGQGGGVLAEWLVDVAREAGYVAQSTSIPGVAQRTGATTYYVEVHPVPVAALGGRAPVLSLVPVPGCIDLFVASELMEAARGAHAGMTSAERTFVVASTARALTTTEKMAPGDGRYAPERLLAVLGRHSRRLAAFDMDAAARDAGTVVSAVLFGAIAGSGVLPFARDAYEAAIRATGLGVDASLAGFARGWAAVRGEDRAPAAAVAGGAEGGVPATGRAAAPQVAPSAPLPADFPAAVREFADLGWARLAEYQDTAYAELYVARLARILAAERALDPAGAHGYALTRETARFLALWMAFDDIVRVADLKSRASRHARVRREVTAGSGDVVRIVDYFKPGAGEFAALLPAPLGRRVVAWDRRRQLAGKGPFGLALKVRADGIGGHLMLRTLASLRWLRRRGSRFADEQAAIERWLAAIAAAARVDWSCAHELALSGRLIKGYGATAERGRDNLAHIVDHLAAGGTFADAAARAAAIRAAREGALADEGGGALDRTLAQHDLPPRAPRAQPIVWTKRRPAPSPHRN